MKVCLDVQYYSNAAVAAALTFRQWDDPSPHQSYFISVQSPQDYEPGAFYRRELRPLLAVIGLIPDNLEVFVIDGYCHLSSDGRLGLGAHLFNEFGRKIPVIGVAKNPFRAADHDRKLYRGAGQRPLYITAVGLSIEEAVNSIRSMDGNFRMPSLLKAVDRHARTAACPLKGLSIPFSVTKDLICPE